MPAERLQAELPMHEDDGVASLEEVLRGRGPARPCGGIDKIALIGVLGLNVPALKLSRKRTLDERPIVSSRRIAARRKLKCAHTLSSRGTVVPPLCVGRVGCQAGPMVDRAGTHGNENDAASLLRLPRHEVAHFVNILLEMLRRWLRRKVGLGGERRWLGVHAGSSHAGLPVRLSSGCVDPGGNGVRSCARGGRRLLVLTRGKSKSAPGNWDSVSGNRR